MTSPNLSSPGPVVNSIKPSPLLRNLKTYFNLLDLGQAASCFEEGVRSELTVMGFEDDKLDEIFGYEIELLIPKPVS